MAMEPLFNESAATRGVGTPNPDIGIVDPTVLWINKEVTKAEIKVNQWRSEARECFRFRDGKQLSREDEEILRQAKRPTNAFNTAQKFVRYVSGVQRDSPTALLFNAVDIDNTEAQLFGERVASYYDWAIEKANGASERSRAFEDFLVGGIGCTNTWIDRSRDPRGLVGYERFSPFELLWPQNEKVNFRGTRWLARETSMDPEEAKALFGSDYAQNLIDRVSVDSAPMMSWPKVDEVPYILWNVETYPLDKLSGAKGEKKDKTRILEFQWWDNDVGYVFADPLDGTEQWMNESAFNEYRAQLDDLFGKDITDYDRQVGRKWQKAFLLNRKWMLEPPTKLAGDRFTFGIMCCHFDEEKRTPYGFFRVLMDPQRYANKFFNQMLETVAKQTKGGYLAESDAFEDKPQLTAFLESNTEIGSVSIVAPNAVANNKIKPKELPQTPQAAMAILNFCVQSMQQVTGISEDSLGIGASTAAGTTLKRRQRAGMVLLASEFDAENDFRKEEGYIVVDHLKLIPDNRLIRVGSKGDGQIVKLEAAPFDLMYEIELDEVERDPNLRQWLAEFVMGPWGQTALRMGKWLPEFYNVLPLPRRWIEKLKQSDAQMQQMQMEAAKTGMPLPGGRGNKKSMPELEALVENKKADTQLKLSKAASLLQKGKTEEFRQMLEALRLQMQATQQRTQTGLDTANMGLDAMRTINDINNPPQGGQP
jgi:hypothetical protein